MYRLQWAKAKVVNRVSLLQPFESILKWFQFCAQLQHWRSYMRAMGLRGWRSYWLLVAIVRLTFHTNLQTTLDKVEGHHCCVCDAAAQDTTKATQGIVFWGAKLAADILCGRREGTQHATCRITCKQDKNQHQKQSHIIEELSRQEENYQTFCEDSLPMCHLWTVWIHCQTSSIIDGSATNVPPFIQITHPKLIKLLYTSDLSMNFQGPQWCSAPLF